MTEEAREKLQVIYDGVTEKARSIIGVFEHQFGSELVDNSLPTFDDFLQILSTKTLGELGIKSLSDSNEYGSYTIDPDDYETNGRGKSFIEYIPDLGIIDYLSPALKNLLRVKVRNANIDLREIFYIIIKFPEVTVTNEYDKSVVIRDLFVKVPVILDGRTSGKFMMTRTTYSRDQWLSDYSHSHLPGVNLEFTTPCTGRGPINRTINTLNLRYDINIWGLYSFEIAKYVITESIAGTPYRRLESIGGNNYGAMNTHRLEYRGEISYYGAAYSVKKLEMFVDNFLREGHIKFAFRNGNFTIGEDFLDIWIRMSNSFIELYNYELKSGELEVSQEVLFASRLVGKHIVSNGRVYNANVVNRYVHTQNAEGTPMFSFKGEVQKLHFTDNDTLDVNNTILIDINLVYYALTKALKIINYRYGRKKTREEGVSTSSRTLYV